MSFYSRIRVKGILSTKMSSLFEKTVFIFCVISNMHDELLAVIFLENNVNDRAFRLSVPCPSSLIIRTIQVLQVKIQKFWSFYVFRTYRIHSYFKKQGKILSNFPSVGETVQDYYRKIQAFEFYTYCCIGNEKKSKALLDYLKKKYKKLINVMEAQPVSSENHSCNTNDRALDIIVEKLINRKALATDRITNGPTLDLS